MQFKHPEILYALFLLLIPIIIHLFQLRRFQKVAFTNVAFLKKVTIQTRKSSQLKKWLTLLLRLLALACVIIAFAQPFTASKVALNTQKETVIYLDNSFSTQAKGAKGPLLDRALQDLFEQSTTSGKLSWFTNNTERKGVSIQEFKNEILSVKHSANQLSPKQVLLKANQLFSKEKGTLKQLLYISDFQNIDALPPIPADLVVNVVQLKPVTTQNIVIDSVYIASKNAITTQLKAQISILNSGNAENTITNTPVSLFNSDNLIAKTAVDFTENNTQIVTFDIENKDDFTGKVELTEANITYDNQLYFNINKPIKIKVLAINEANGSFLQRLFNKTEFQFSAQTLSNLDYNTIVDQHFIVLNELENIPASLATALKSFSDNGGSILIIPAVKAEVNSYNSLLKSLNIGTLTQQISNEKKITKISFSHPLFSEVFEKEVSNFQYPKVNSFFTILGNVTPALRFEDNLPFLIQKNKSFLFTASINKDNSNFQNSPLVVPTIYNMALQSLPLPNLYYTIGKPNIIAVPVKLGNDEILTIKNSNTQFIPIQQTKAKFVVLNTLENPAVAGNYNIVKDNQVLENISYNYPRSQSNLQYLNAEDWPGVNVYPSVENLFTSLTEDSSINSFWKWFAIFALLCLLAEMLVLRLNFTKRQQQ
ncbi:MAG: hypothetical protein CL526_09160 [Aequorivita sp.]|nr:hypothetical protein [Aequorivita sp.]|tara:strand:+ start:142301 stop:144256 length:1956 start_codon:yes stop_codon:yes gene_type:complete